MVLRYIHVVLIDGTPESVHSKPIAHWISQLDHQAIASTIHRASRDHSFHGDGTLLDGKRRDVERGFTVSLEAGIWKEKRPHRALGRDTACSSAGAR